MEYPKIIVMLDKPTNGYWDGGAKQRFVFEVIRESSDNKGYILQWGAWSANFWFWSAKGKTPKLSASYAIRRIRNLCKLPCTITTEM